MLAPLSWIRDFTPVPDDVGLIVDTCNSLGLIVDGVRRVGGGLDGVVVARVLEVRPHPNADKVRLSDVDLGDGQPLQIACGAANLAAGQLVAVATIGTTLPNGMTIERRKLRGEWSNGMICSSDELGLAIERSPGIMVLPEGLTVGAPFAEQMGIVPDVVLDLEIETNRPDAMCIAGIARDLAARLELPFAIPEPQIVESGGKTADLVEIQVDDPDLCPRFTARVLTGVSIVPSPDLIAQRLTLAGMRPINNVVDASNYVMLELGQPSHPYDLDRLPGAGLRARRARDGEVLQTLDGADRKLTDRDCVIADGNDDVVGIAGIMGGASSEIDGTTTRLVVEAAVFDAYAVNYTSRRLALRTDASARFERRVDPEAVERASNRFCELVQRSCPEAEVSVGLTDVRASEPSPLVVPVRTARVNQILGTELTDEQIRELLAPIGYRAAADGDGMNQVTIPSFRPDGDREIDVIEEIARMFGYDNIERRVPTAPAAGGLTPHQRHRRELHALLRGFGITEAWTSPILGPGDLSKAGLSEDAVELVNPIVSEESRLRTSLLPGFLKVVALNQSRRNLGVRVFETAHVFLPPQGPSAPGPDDRNAALPMEPERLGIVLADGSDDARTAASTWISLRNGLRVEGVSVVPAPVAGLHPTRSAELRAADGSVIGVVGEVDPDVLSNHGIDRRVGWIEVDVPALFAHIVEVPQNSPISRFPAADFDLAFVVPDVATSADVQTTIESTAGAVLERVELFDVFRSAQLGEGKRSLAFRLRVAELDHTLSEAEVAAVRSRVIEAVEARHEAVLRA